MGEVTPKVPDLLSIWTMPTFVLCAWTRSDDNSADGEANSFLTTQDLEESRLSNVGARLPLLMDMARREKSCPRENCYTWVVHDAGVNTVICSSHAMVNKWETRQLPNKCLFGPLLLFHYPVLLLESPQPSKTDACSVQSAIGGLKWFEVGVTKICDSSDFSAIGSGIHAVI